MAAALQAAYSASFGAFCMAQLLPGQVLLDCAKAVVTLSPNFGPDSGAAGGVQRDLRRLLSQLLPGQVTVLSLGSGYVELHMQHCNGVMVQAA